MIKYHKRGIAMDIMVFGILLFIIALGIIVVHSATKPVLNDILENGDLQTNNATSSIQYARQTLINLDYLLPTFAVLLLIFFWISASLIDSTPLFFVIMIILIVIFVMAGALISNAFEDFENDDTLTETVANYPITFLMMKNWMIFAVVAGFGGLVAFFAKPK